MPKIPPIKAKIVVKVLLKASFYKHHQTGSHIQLRHRKEIHLRVTIPRHDRFDLPPFVISSILKQANLTKEEFLKLLKGN